MNELPIRNLIAAKAALEEKREIDRSFRCRRCSAWVGIVHNGVLYLWKGIGDPPVEQCHHFVDPVRMKCGQCNSNIRWRPLPPHVPRGKQGAIDTDKPAG